MKFDDGLYNMYREVDELSLLNKLFATLISEKMNLKNYLSNIVVTNQLYLKDLLTDLTYTIESALDDIINLIKIKKGYPVFQLDDIELISIIKTNVSTEYKENIVIDNLKNEINIIISLIKDIISKIDINKNYEILTILSNISYQLKSSLLELP